MVITWIMSKQEMKQLKKWEGQSISLRRGWLKKLRTAQKDSGTVRSKTKVKSGIRDLIKDDGVKTQTDEEKAELLNDFFVSVFTQEYTSQPRFDGEPLKDVNT